MSNDYDFNEEREDFKKLDFKKIFFTAKEGTNTIRIVDLKGKSFKIHYVNNIKGQKVFVKSPGAGDPLIAEGQKPRTRYYLQVIDRESGIVKVWEFGSQIKQSIEEFISELKDKRAKDATDAGDVLTAYDLELRKRKPGSNPLYTLSMRQRLSKQALEADQRVIDEADIDFEPLLKPWSIERIKEQILGQGGSGASSDSGTGASSAPSAPNQAPKQAQASAPSEPAPKAPAPSAPPTKSAEAWLDD